MKLEPQLINARLAKLTSKEKSTLSFVHFIEFIQKQEAEEKTIRRHLFQYILNEVKKHPQWLEDIETESLKDYEILCELIYATVVPFISNEPNQLWGLAHPLLPCIFYGTDAFYSMLRKWKDNEASETEQLAEEEKMDQWRYTHVYSFLLQKGYGLPVPLHNEFTKSYVDEESGLLKYITINIDMSFVSVLGTDTLPKLDSAMSSATMDGRYINYLRQNLPLGSFQFKGFTICTVTDTTALNVLENIRNAVVDQNPRDPLGTVQEILTLLKSLMGNTNINFGMLPILKVNKHLVTPSTNMPISFLVNAAREQNISEDVFLKYFEEFHDNPSLHFFNASDDLSENIPFDQIFHQSGTETLAIIPIFHSYDLVGLLEVHTQEKDVLNESSLALLENALPLLAQLLQKNIHELQFYIDDRIKSVFTSIQPSVEWKFKEAVWSHMKELQLEEESIAIPTVSFHDVYPLYGAIDVRNSTLERNKALQADLIFQSNAVLQILENINQKTSLPRFDQLLLKSRSWYERVKRNLLTIDEIEFNDFVSIELMPFLLEAQLEFPLVHDIVKAFRKSNDVDHGAFFKNRRALESSMKKVIMELSQHIDLFRDQIQKVYPTYFEKFRTDGIEYDLYLGQSIAPEKPFDYSYLSTLRMMQLRSMVKIVKLTHALLPELAVPLKTTQLIFINPSSIDISFRNDERRFDVEGAYNIRYQVIKKRIDKVSILSSNERLTQPNKIAIVYYNNLEGAEYKKHIRQLQEENLILSNVEELELEELQGISGLKAMRVEVKV